jgi:hypothetical protein
VRGLEHVPTQETRAMVAGRKAQGRTHEEIADYFEISVDTLTKHYAVELRTAKPLFMDRVHAALEKRLSEGSDKLITLCLTHQCGWRSADKMAEIDAQKEIAAQAEATHNKLNEYTAELRAAKEE